jgi:catechol 2,3-dioxygenase-like lactoylglutathione lyase family enzyme
MSEGVSPRTVSHIGMLVDDVGACMEFYADVIGFKRMYHAELGSGLVLGGVGLRDTLIEFIHAAPGTPTLSLREQVGAGRTHVAVTVTELQKALETLERAGVSVFDGPRVVGSANIAFVLDPERRPVELVEFSGGEARAMDFLGED